MGVSTLTSLGGLGVSTHTSPGDLGSSLLALLSGLGISRLTYGNIGSLTCASLGSLGASTLALLGSLSASLLSLLGDLGCSLLTPLGSHGVLTPTSLGGIGSSLLASIHGPGVVTLVTDSLRGYPLALLGDDRSCLLLASLRGPSYSWLANTAVTVIADAAADAIAIVDVTLAAAVVVTSTVADAQPVIWPGGASTRLCPLRHWPLRRRPRLGPHRVCSRMPRIVRLHGFRRSREGLSWGILCMYMT